MGDEANSVKPTQNEINLEAMQRTVECLAFIEKVLGEKELTLDTIEIVQAAKGWVLKVSENLKKEISELLSKMETK